jgi:excinuclease ABC subunit A
VSRDTPATIFADLSARAAAAGDPRLVVSFRSRCRPISARTRSPAARPQGYTRIHARDGAVLHVVQDRFRLGGAEHARVMEALETGLAAGHGRLTVHALGDGETRWKFSTGLHCADCDIAYADPRPACSPSTRPSAPAKPAAASGG